MTTMNETAMKLAEMIRAHPDAKIVTDVGCSMFSGWGKLQDMDYHQDENVIELIFD
jgi:hypothetical protein